MLSSRDVASLRLGERQEPKPDRLSIPKKFQFRADPESLRSNVSTFGLGWRGMAGNGVWVDQVGLRFGSARQDSAAGLHHLDDSFGLPGDGQQLS